MSAKHGLKGWDETWSKFCDVLRRVHRSHNEWLVLTRYLAGAVATNASSPPKAKVVKEKQPTLSKNIEKGGILFVPIYSRDYCLGVSYRLAKLFSRSSPHTELCFVVPDGPIPKEIREDRAISWVHKQLLRKFAFCPLVLFAGVWSYCKAVVTLQADRITNTAMRECFGNWRMHLAKSVGIYYWEISCARRWLKKHEIKSVVTINDVVKPAAPFIAAANQLGIPTVVLQHGAPGPHSAPFLAENSWVWGETSRSLLCHFGADGGKLKIIGNLEVDDCLYDTKESDNDTRELLLLSQWHGGPGWGTSEFQNFFPEVAEAAKLSEHRWNIKIRLHPNEGEDVERQIIELIEPYGMPYSFSRGVDPIEDDVAACDFACTVSSSSIMHAVAAGKPCALKISKALEKRLGVPLLHRKQVAHDISMLTELLNASRVLSEDEKGEILAHSGHAYEEAAVALLDLIQC